MTDVYAYFCDVSREVQPPAAGILSRTLHHDDRLKVVVFGFAAGEELSEHTAATPAILLGLSGTARLTLGAEPQVFGPGSLVWMSPQLPHSVWAETPVVLLLFLLK